MTPKEQATQLLEKFINVMFSKDERYVSITKPRAAAILCVDEILAASPMEPFADPYYELVSDRQETVKEFWLNVKKELQSL